MLTFRSVYFKQTTCGIYSYEIVLALESCRVKMLSALRVYQTVSGVLDCCSGCFCCLGAACAQISHLPLNYSTNVSGHSWPEHWLFGSADARVCTLMVRVGFLDIYSYAVCLSISISALQVWAHSPPNAGPGNWPTRDPFWKHDTRCS